MTDLTAKARRAAEWLPLQPSSTIGPKFTDLHFDSGNWIFHRGWYRMDDASFITFCEDRGWQDQEADEVEWRCDQETAFIGSLEIRVSADKSNGDFGWAIWDQKKIPSYQCRGTAPTREEARRQAVEAARGMG